MRAILALAACCIASSATAGGEILGWGDNFFGQATPPAGNFLAIAAAVDHSVAIRPDGTLVAWGTPEGGALLVPPGQFSRVSAGGLSGHDYSIAIRLDG